MQAVKTSAWRIPVHQQRVDEILAAARAERAQGRSHQPAEEKRVQDVRPSCDPTDLQLAQELEMLRVALTSLGERFASDPEFLDHYGTELQSFDRMGQVLGHLSQVIAAEDKAPAIECIGMQELRLRLRRTLVRPVDCGQQSR
jgi:hypothetical protein